MSNSLNFRPIATLAGVEAFRALKSGLSMIISFDHRHPELKWRASVQDKRSGADKKTVYLPGPFDTREDAAQALLSKFQTMVQ